MMLSTQQGCSRFLFPSLLLLVSLCAKGEGFRFRASRSRPQKATTGLVTQQASLEKDDAVHVHAHVHVSSSGGEGTDAHRADHRDQISSQVLAMVDSVLDGASIGKLNLTAHIDGMASEDAFNAVLKYEKNSLDIPVEVVKILRQIKSSRKS